MIYDMPEVKQRILNREQVSTYRVISRYVLNNAEFNAVERAAGDMMVELVSEVLRERVVGETQTAELNVPASWWDAFKQTYSDSWWLRRFVKRYPVRFTTLKKTVTFQRYHNYPNADVVMSPTPLGRPIVYETVEQSDWSTS